MGANLLAVKPTQPTRTERALLAALRCNRGELDAATLARLLARLDEPVRARPAA